MRLWFRKNHAAVLSEDFAIQKRRQLRADLELYDAALRSLTDDLREERMRSGLAFYQELPTSMRSPRMQALQLGLVQLSNWHSQALKEHANL